LKAVAQALTRAARDFDVVARYGGEEFAVILPSCSWDDSLSAAERLRTAVSKVKSHATITASAGVATFPGHRLSEMTGGQEPTADQVPRAIPLRRARSKKRA
jgi:diguanylate cyclase (GGDEF)-like protein